MLVLVVAPGAGWLLYNHNRIDISPSQPDIQVQPASKNELLKILTSQHKESHFFDTTDATATVTGISSYKLYDHWWYLVNVTTTDSASETFPVLLVKFYDGSNSIRIVTNPNEPLPHQNISDSLGIPYDVIDAYNKALAEVEYR